MPRFRKLLTHWATYLDERLGIATLKHLALKKTVPVHRHTVWYYLGGMTLFLFTVQVVTGILLLFYYRPSAAEAFESVRFVMAEVSFGWLVRSLHWWAANLMIAMLFLHLFSVLLLRAYRRPREFTWLSGMGLFGISLAFGFTGYLLPWNELAYFATRVGTEITGAVPLVGSFLLTVARGGEDVSGATLSRFFAFHVAVLPVGAMLLMGAHLYLVQKHGMSVPPKVERQGGADRSMPFVPHFLLRDIVGWLTAFLILTMLAAFMPAELGQEADPFASAPAGIKPEWYFMFMFQTLKYLPSHIVGIEGEIIGILGFALAGMLLLLVPFLDRSVVKNPTSKIMTYIGVAMIAYMIVLSILGYADNPTQ